MKAIKIMALALLCTLFASCMNGDWDSPLAEGNAPVGNNTIRETNVISISDLKAKYAATIANSGCQVINDDIQIKGRVTGNDVEGNIYQQLFIEDSTAAVCIAVSTSSISKDLGVGQEIIVDLKGLYIGAYRKQPQIGGLYNGAIGRMTYNTWKQHFKAIGQPDPSKVMPTEFDFDDYQTITASQKDKFLTENCGRLMTVRGVTIDQSGTKVYAPDDGSVYLTSNCANRAINGKTNVVLRTSSYADFHNNPLPEGKVNITGIFTRFDNTLQILMRQAADVEDAR